MPKRSAKPLTEAAVKGAKATGRLQDIPDGIVPGLTLRVTPAGARSWTLRYRLHGRLERVTIGTYPAMALARARERAREALEALGAGARPRNHRRASLAPLSAIGEAWEDYLDAVVRPRHRSAAAQEAAWRNHWAPAIGRMPVEAVKRADLARVVDGLVKAGRSAMARNAIAYVRPFFAWAVERDLIEASPVVGLRPPPPVAARDRVLNLDELHRLWHAAGQLGYPFGPAVQLLILTGQRRDEIGGMDWAELDPGAAVIHLPSARTKNRRPHDVPLASAALELLGTIALGGAELREGQDMPWPATGPVFTGTGKTPVSGWSRAKRRLDALLPTIGGDGKELERPRPVAPWRMHDVRRSVATGMLEAGLATREAVERLLNHISGSFGGIVGVYQRAELWGDQVKAAEGWAALVIPGGPAAGGGGRRLRLVASRR